jgi:serine/threonine protein kinase
LAFIHFKGVVHKDIKPHNILISGEDSTAKIADFGLSQQLASQSSAGGHTAGTLEYMAPEASEQRGSSFKSDVFSFGVLMFDLLMRRHESRFTSIEDRVAKALRTCVDRSDFPSSLSRDMELVVKGASEREKPSRYSSQTLKELISSVVAKDGGDARTTQTHRSFDLVFDFMVGLKRHRRQRVGAAGGRAAVNQNSGSSSDSSSGISDYTSRADQSVDGSTWAAIGTPPPSPPPPSSSVISLESASAEEIGTGDCYKP